MPFWTTDQNWHLSTSNLTWIWNSLPLCLKWTGGTHRYEADSQSVNVKICGQNGKQTYEPLTSYSYPSNHLRYDSTKGWSKYSFDPGYWSGWIMSILCWCEWVVKARWVSRLPLRLTSAGQSLATRKQWITFPSNHVERLSKDDEKKRKDHATLFILESRTLFER